MIWESNPQLIVYKNNRSTTWANQRLSFRPRRCAQPWLHIFLRYKIPYISCVSACDLLCGFSRTNIVGMTSTLLNWRTALSLRTLNIPSTCYSIRDYSVWLNGWVVSSIWRHRWPRLILSKGPLTLYPLISIVVDEAARWRAKNQARLRCLLRRTVGRLRTFALPLPWVAPCYLLSPKGPPTQALVNIITLKNNFIFLKSTY